MAEVGYRRILREDLEEHRSCPLKWDCAACTKTLCVRLVAVAELPSIHGTFRILGFINNKDGKDHTLIAKGDVTGHGGVLARVHSSCVTGESLGSLRCDCGPQLHRALEMLEAEGEGVLVYMQQEGRGIGLTNKLRTYMLQDTGLDTYDANVALGFPPDDRDYEVAAAMLAKLEVKSLRLITNNPDKAYQLQMYGVAVDGLVPLEVAVNDYDRRYFETKRDKFRHNLTLRGEKQPDPCGCNN